VLIRGVIFDIGGVLEMTPATGWQDRWSADLGLGRAELEARLEPLFLAGATGRTDLREIERQIGEALGLDERAASRLMDDLWAEYLGTLNLELAAYFRRLRPRYRTAILSNSFVGAREREHALYGFADMCDLVIYSHEEGLLTPDSRFYLIACARLGLPPESCVFLDDVPACVAGARAVGMHGITFIDNAQAIAELDQLLRNDPPFHG
jgi:putative hydrolase of the HAD superfamily